MLMMGRLSSAINTHLYQVTRIFFIRGNISIDARAYTA